MNILLWVASVYEQLKCWNHQNIYARNLYFLNSGPKSMYVYEYNIGAFKYNGNLVGKNNPKYWLAI